MIDALAEFLKIKREDIELHNTPQSLYDYVNKQRPETAHIIVRKEHVGNSSNDMGFRRNQEGTYTMIVDEYSLRHKGYGKDWIKKLKALYTEKVVKKVLEKQGYSITKTVLPNNQIKLGIQY